MSKRVKNTCFEPAGEPVKDEAGYWWQWPDGSCGVSPHATPPATCAIPLRRTVTFAPEPETRVVAFRFEPVSEPVEDEAGICWMLGSGGEITDTVNPTHYVGPRTKWLHRTVERQVVDPKRWSGVEAFRGCLDDFYLSIWVEGDWLIEGINHPTREAAQAIAPILKRWAEDYAATLGATIEWENDNNE